VAGQRISSHQRAFSPNQTKHQHHHRRLVIQQHRFIDTKHQISVPKKCYDKQQQWPEVKENHLGESRREAKSALMEARSNRATLARLVFRLVLRNFDLGFFEAIPMC
jgi:hypothetical protein